MRTPLTSLYDRIKFLLLCDDLSPLNMPQAVRICQEKKVFEILLE